MAWEQKQRVPDGKAKRNRVIIFFDCTTTAPALYIHSAEPFLSLDEVTPNFFVQPQNIMRNSTRLSLIPGACLLMCLCTSGTQKLQAREQPIPSGQSIPAQKPLVTFLELGSDKCMPCRQMQPVLHAIESKYGPQVKVLFYNVWSDKERHYGKEYAIRIIPTQIFLDNLGKEFFRHEGFFPETEIDKLLKKQGLIPLSNK